MDLVRAARDLADGAHRCVQHDRVAGTHTEAAKVVSQSRARMH
jgi:hypothetical protein